MNENEAATIKERKAAYGMVWYGMVWYGMVWYGMVWYGMVILAGTLINAHKRVIGHKERYPEYLN